MTQFIFSNNANTTLAAGISNSATSVTVLAGTGELFPSPGAGQYFAATFVQATTGTETEIVHVTAVSGDTMTIVRAQEGTGALTWNAGDTFALFPTAGVMSSFLQTANLPALPFSGWSDTGAANAYVITPSPAITSYVEFQAYSFKAGSANTGASTVNINGVGAAAIVNRDGSALRANQIQTGSIVLIEYDGANWQLVSATTEFATNAEAQTGTSTSLTINPAALAYMFGLQGITCGSNTNGVWVEFSGTGIIVNFIGISASLPGNASYTYTLPKAFPSALMGCVGSSINTTATPSDQGWFQLQSQIGNPATTVEIYLNQQGGGGPTAVNGLSAIVWGK